MCGRYALTTSTPRIARLLGLLDGEEHPPRYNVTPSQRMPVVWQDREGQMQITGMRWGLLPNWADDPRIAHRLINARAETVAVKPAFRAAFRRRRCLIPADGFYEWQPGTQGKQPYFIHLRGSEPFFMAGLWEHWERDAQPPVLSFSIITTPSNTFMRPIHDRMPAILPASAWQGWLSGGDDQRQELEHALHQAPSADLVAYPVSRHVNNPRHDDARCLEPLHSPN